VIIAAILGAMVFTPGAEKAAEAIEAGDEAGTRSATARLARFGALDTILLLFAMAVMIIRWE
jgi:hypothetical protein